MASTSTTPAASRRSALFAGFAHVLKVSPTWADSQDSPILDVEAGFECSGYKMSAPTLVGSGAHGFVYADSTGSLVAKISRRNTGPIIDAECVILRRLEAAGAPHVERCLGSCSVQGRTVALLAPYIPDGKQISTTVMATLGPVASERLLKDMAQFLVRCFAAGIAVSDRPRDLQGLVRPDGHVVFIDFTEAGPLDDSIGAVRAMQFVGEWCGVLLPKAHGLAARLLAAELRLLVPGSFPRAAADALLEIPLTQASSAEMDELGASIRAAAGYFDP